ncbi:MAG: hypothetical protein AB1765_01980 [Candidatus Hydrogenedentota bacterium]
MQRLLFYCFLILSFIFVDCGKKEKIHYLADRDNLQNKPVNKKNIPDFMKPLPFSKEEITKVIYPTAYKKNSQYYYKENEIEYNIILREVHKGNVDNDDDLEYGIGTDLIPVKDKHNKYGFFTIFKTTPSELKVFYQIKTAFESKRNIIDLSPNDNFGEIYIYEIASDISKNLIISKHIIYKYINNEFKIIWEYADKYKDKPSVQCYFTDLPEIAGEDNFWEIVIKTGKKDIIYRWDSEKYILEKTIKK